MPLKRRFFVLFGSWSSWPTRTVFGLGCMPSPGGFVRNGVGQPSGETDTKRERVCD